MLTCMQVSQPGNFHVWLASPEARFLKGKFLYANWDVDELRARAEELEKTELLNIQLVGWPFAITLVSRATSRQKDIYSCTTLN